MDWGVDQRRVGLEWKLPTSPSAPFVRFPDSTHLPAFLFTSPGVHAWGSGTNNTLPFSVSPPSGGAIGATHPQNIMRRPGLIACSFLLAIAMLFSLGCNPSPANRAGNGRLRVFAGIPPLAFLVEQIGGEHVKVDVLVQPGQDPHTFEPTPQQVVALGRAAVFFKIDMPFEAVLLEKVLEGSKRLAVVDATKGIKKLPLAGPCSGEAGHEHDHELHADESDPHVWLSPPLLKTMAANIAAELCRADPDNKPTYERNLATLVNRIDAVHARAEKLLASYQGRAFYVFHPGFAYFAEAYGLKEVPIQIGGQTPSLKQLRELIGQAEKDRVTTLFIQPEFDPQSVQAIADAIHGQVVPINGLGKDVVADIEDIAVKIGKAMRESSTEKNGQQK